VGAFVQFAEVYQLDLEELVEPTMERATAEQVEKAEWMYAEHNHTKLSREQFMACDIIKQGWRSAHPATCQLWWDLDSVVRTAIAKGPVREAYRAGPHLQVSYQGDYLMVKLPSGRFLWYRNPRLVNDTIEYDGVEARSWVTVRTYGGKLVENVTQAVARDIMVANMRKIASSFDLVGTVHDEWITEVDEDDGAGHELLSVLMSRVPAWGEGLPLDAAGYTSKRYRK